jgi:hypothetical protein
MITILRNSIPIRNYRNISSERTRDSESNDLMIFVGVTFERNSEGAAEAQIDNLEDLLSLSTNRFWGLRLRWRTSVVEDLTAEKSQKTLVFVGSDHERDRRRSMREILFLFSHYVNKSKRN